MTDSTGTNSKVSPATWIGLFIALFGVLIARQAISYFWPTLTFTAAVWKETLVWLCAIAVLLIVRRGERLPFGSIGIGTTKWWKSILWGFVLAIVCGLIGGALVAITHYSGGQG